MAALLQPAGDGGEQVVAFDRCLLATGASAAVPVQVDARLDPLGLRRSEDSFVDELFAAA